MNYYTALIRSISWHDKYQNTFIQESINTN